MGTQPPGGRNKALIAGLAAVLVVIIAAVAWFVFKPSPQQPVAVVVAPTKPPSTSSPISESDESNSQPPAATNPPVTTQPPAHNPDKKQRTPTETTPSQSHAPDTTAHVTPPPPPVHQETAAPTDLSGQWQGFYFDKTSQAKTTVHLSIREVDGNHITGSLQYQTPDNTTGQCDLSGSSYQGGTLRLLTHCVPKLPYLNTYTTFQGVDPTAKLLSGGKVFNASNMVASLQRN